VEKEKYQKILAALMFAKNVEGLEPLKKSLRLREEVTPVVE
jgi:hypothetical protein